MKSEYGSMPKRGRIEFHLAVVLLVGIMTALVLPAPKRGMTDGREDALFTLVEPDYAHPLISSASAIRVLNGAAKQVAEFAGYDEFSSRVDIDHLAIVANITRFSGDLLAMLKVGFIARLRTASNEPHIYISENFRQRFLADKGNVVGTTLRIHCIQYRIAGITRESAAGLLNSTDIWIPVRSRSDLGTVNSMKVLGALAPESDWNTAEAKIHAAFKSCEAGQVDSDAMGARLLPLAKRIQFHSGENVAATDNTKGPRLHVYYQPAALPFTRGS